MPFLHALVCVCAFMALSLAPCPAFSLQYDTRTVSGGDVRGVVNDTVACTFWKGVPFAADTSGANRFMPPQPREPWCVSV
jgi:para-nitrobenzyl esterase